MNDRDPATLQAIATEAGLSVTSVSKILRGQYKGNTPKGRRQVALVTDLAHKRGYVANSSARRLRHGRHDTVLVSLPVDDFGHPPTLVLDYLTGINQTLREAGMSIAIWTHHRNQGSDNALPDERFFDAALVLEESNPALERQLNGWAVPVVNINVAEAPGRVVVRRDEFAAGRLLLEALHRLGYRSAHIIGEGESGGHFSHHHRTAGLRAAAIELGMDCPHLDMPWWSGGWPKIIQALPLSHAVPLIATDAQTVLALLRWIPHDQPIACLDDLHTFYEIFRGLTRVSFDRMALGRLAAHVLLTRLANPEAALSVAPLVPTVYVGSSTPDLTSKK